MESFVVVLEQCATGYAAFSPDVPDCVATGRTVEQTLAEIRSALVFHFEGMAATGEPMPDRKGLEHYVRNGEHIADTRDLLTTLPADELLATLSQRHDAGTPS